MISNGLYDRYWVTPPPELIQFQREFFGMRGRGWNLDTDHLVISRHGKRKKKPGPSPSIEHWLNEKGLIMVDRSRVRRKYPL